MKKEEHMKKLGIFIHILTFTYVLFYVFTFGGHKAIAEDSIFVAAAVEDVAKVSVMLATDPTLVDAKSEERDGMTPLMWAAEHGNLEVVKLLIEKGAKVDGKSIKGHTPLMFAAEKMQLDVMKLLIEKSANTEAEGQNLTAGLIVSRPDIRMIMGAMGVRNRNFNDAIAILNIATTSNPRGPMAFRNRGLIYAYKKQYDKAIADYSKAIDLLPFYSELYDERGGSYAENGDYDLAIADFNKAVELNVQNVRAYFFRGCTNLLKGNHIKISPSVAKVCLQEAIADFTKTIELSSDNPAADMYRRQAYEILELYDVIKN